MSSSSIALRSQSFDVYVWTPALKVSRTVLNATNDIVSVDESNFGEPDIVLD
jgi:hypothetical protein